MYAAMSSFRRLLERRWRRLRQIAPTAERRRMHVHAAFAEEHGPSVRTGPFRGMVYPPAAFRAGTGFNMAARLLGSYEAELHDVVERVVTDGFGRILDVGSGDGYYAVGLARRLPGCTVEAYDPDPVAQRLCHALAHANGVLDRVDVRHGATCDDLRVPRAGRTFVKMDCEGCELELLRPDESELLRCSTILVELHDFLGGDTTHEVLGRFEPTHVAELVESRPRSVEDYPELALLDEAAATAIVSERRPADLRWALLTPV